MKGTKMAVGPGQPTNAFSATRVALAQALSGVYAICNSQGQYLYFGETNDIQRRLSQHLSDVGHCMHRYGASSYAFDLVSDATARLRRQNELIAAHLPACNQM